MGYGCFDHRGDKYRVINAWPNILDVNDLGKNHIRRMRKFKIRALGLEAGYQFYKNLDMKIWGPLFLARLTHISFVARGPGKRARDVKGTIEEWLKWVENFLEVFA